MRTSTIVRVSPGKLASFCKRVYLGETVMFAMPIEGINKGVLTRIEGADIYLNVTLPDGSVINGVHRLENEIWPTV